MNEMNLGDFQFSAAKSAQRKTLTTKAPFYVFIYVPETALSHTEMHTQTIQFNDAFDGHYLQSSADPKINGAIRNLSLLGKSERKRG